jgi:hypothetical protein
MPDGDQFYSAHSGETIARFRALTDEGVRLLRAEYGPGEADSIAESTMQAFAELLQDLPDIGGERSHLVPFLLDAAWCIALHKVLRERGESVDHIGRLVYEIHEAGVSFLGLSPAPGRDQAWIEGQRKMRAEFSARSQARQYPADWVSYAVPPTAEEFDWGYDYTECGAVKLFQAHGAMDLAPYFCLLDAVTYPALGLGLTRTQILGRGDSRCDFRVTVGGSVRLLDAFSRSTLEAWGRQTEG